MTVGDERRAQCRHTASQRWRRHAGNGVTISTSATPPTMWLRVPERCRRVESQTRRELGVRTVIIGQRTLPVDHRLMRLPIVASVATVRVVRLLDDKPARVRRRLMVILVVVRQRRLHVAVLRSTYKRIADKPFSNHASVFTSHWHYVIFLTVGSHAQQLTYHICCSF